MHGITADVTFMLWDRRKRPYRLVDDHTETCTVLKKDGEAFVYLTIDGKTTHCNAWYSPYTHRWECELPGEK